ncbi:MAG: HD domain-containing protein [Saprospiraceae bacterium]|nr:HD domain-containing protein [Saprospiraceae bacterium]
MNKRKIINDPVYGFTTIPDDFIYDLIQHPFFQRLRRVKQLGLTDFVYPGASHTRFQHALGALHLMTLAIESLRSKGVVITPEEAQGAQIAILLHDIGHSPFSHALEKKLISLDHEYLSLSFMKLLNEEFKGKLNLAIQIFTNRYPKRFLHQLVSSQLDVDRMDYLNRDSFYTGVAEGVIGYERLIKMINVVNNRLVVEEKGILTIEKFLISRRIMYWQVYLHKTVLAAEKMLIHWLDMVTLSGELQILFPALYVLKNAGNQNKKKLLTLFADIDDSNVTFALKFSTHSPNSKIRILAEGILNRRLFKCQLSAIPFTNSFKKELLVKAKHPDLLFEGVELNTGYNLKMNEIMVLKKNNKTVPLSKISELNYIPGIESKYYIVYS